MRVLFSLSRVYPPTLVPLFQVLLPLLYGSVAEAAEQERHTLRACLLLLSAARATRLRPLSSEVTRLAAAYPEASFTPTAANTAPAVGGSSTPAAASGENALDAPATEACALFAAYLDTLCMRVSSENVVFLHPTQELLLPRLLKEEQKQQPLRKMCLKQQQYALLPALLTSPLAVPAAKELQSLRRLMHALQQQACGSLREAAEAATSPADLLPALLTPPRDGDAQAATSANERATAAAAATSPVKPSLLLAYEAPSQPASLPEQPPQQQQQPQHRSLASDMSPLVAELHRHLKAAAGSLPAADGSAADAAAASHWLQLLMLQMPLDAIATGLAVTIRDELIARIARVGAAASPAAASGAPNPVHAAPSAAAASSAAGASASHASAELLLLLQLLSGTSDYVWGVIRRSWGKAGEAGCLRQRGECVGASPHLHTLRQPVSAHAPCLLWSLFPLRCIDIQCLAPLFEWLELRLFDSSAPELRQPATAHRLVAAWQHLQERQYVGIRNELARRFPRGTEALQSLMLQHLQEAGVAFVLPSRSLLQQQLLPSFSADLRCRYTVRQLADKARSQALRLILVDPAEPQAAQKILAEALSSR
ncbi:hypothetical protein cyc_02033 [Cyclospora cayetanensis]|uniref:Uncharacterized protein n=1 Tax=Cyclospora cayetanensis TaxID=88456 RepID=A0A1D3CW95_9EIME|nr:hypothetical protein cyc_02033 [Cyclospora cayetanensis]